MTTTATRKAKGREGQKEVMQILLQSAPELEPLDIRSTSMGASGEDLLLSPKARLIYPISPEVKRRKSGFKFFYDAIEQTDRPGNRYAPVVFYRQDRKYWMVTQRLEDWLRMIR